MERWPFKTDLLITDRSKQAMNMICYEWVCYELVCFVPCLFSNVDCFQIWSVMKVVCYELFCYEHGLLWTGLLWRCSVLKCGLLWTWSVMNVICYELVCYEWVCYEHVLLWRRPVMNTVCYERVCYERGLLRTWSVMNRSVTNRSVTNVVCFEWSVVSGLLWTGLFWKGTVENDSSSSGKVCARRAEKNMPSNVGARTQPCLTPLQSGKVLDMEPPNWTLTFMFSWNATRMESSVSGQPNSFSMFYKPDRLTVRRLWLDLWKRIQRAWLLSAFFLELSQRKYHVWCTSRGAKATLTLR